MQSLNLTREPGPQAEAPGGPARPLRRESEPGPGTGGSGSGLGILGLAAGQPESESAGPSIHSIIKTNRPFHRACAAAGAPLVACPGVAD